MIHFNTMVIVMTRLLCRAHQYVFASILPMIPLAGFFWGGSDQLANIAIPTAVLGAAIFLAGIAWTFGGRSTSGPLATTMTLVGAPLFVAAVISHFVAERPVSVVALFGEGGEFGSIVTYVLVALCAALCMNLTRRSGVVFLHSLLGTASIVSVAALLMWTGVGFFAPLTSIATHIAFTLSAAAVAAALLMDARLRFRAAYASVCALALAGFFVFFHLSAAVAGIAAVIAHFMYWFLQKDGRLSDAFPVGTLLVGGALAIMLFIGPRAPQVDVPPVVRPSWLATEYIVGAEYTSSLRAALLGTGPGSLPYAWNAYRPVEFNAGTRWDVTPSTTYSTAANMAIEIGIIGLAAFLVLPASLLYIVLSRRSTAYDDRTVLALVSLMILTSAFAYPIDLPLMLVAAGALGLSVRSEGEAGVSADRSVNGGLAIYITALTVACIGVFLFVTAWLLARATLHDLRGRAALEQNDNDRAARMFDVALATWPSALHLKNAALAHGRIFLDKATDAGVSPAVSATAKLDADRAAALAERARAASDRDFVLWSFEGHLFLMLARYRYAGAEENSRVAFERAEVLAPTRPDMPYQLALYYVSTGDLSKAEEAARRSLSLKSDFEPSVELLRELERAAEDQHDNGDTE